jgi:hypothetical protein
METVGSAPTELEHRDIWGGSGPASSYNRLSSGA